MGTKELSNEKFKPQYKANKSYSPKLIWMSNSKIRLKFKRSYLKQEYRAAYSPNNVVNLYIVYELNMWSQDLSAEFTLKDCFLKG